MQGITIRKSDIARHLDVLCNQIGNRYSGSKGEKKATEYIAENMRKFGLLTRIQPFDFLNWKPQTIKAFLIKDGKEMRIPKTGPFLYSTSTDIGGVAGDIVYIESNQPEFFRKRRLRGKIGLNIGAFDIADPQVADRIMDSGLSGMMSVDDRIPFSWRVPIGQAPQWSDNYNLPTVAVPYMKAIAIEKQLPAKARLEITAWKGARFAAQNIPTRSLLSAPTRILCCTTQEPMTMRQDVLLCWNSLDLLGKRYLQGRFVLSPTG
jgi:hypothetical protein